MFEAMTFDEAGLPRRRIELKYDQPLVLRRAFQLLSKAVERKDIEVVLGPRQCGKTTLLVWLIEFLKKEKAIASDRIIYCDLDWIVDFSLFDSPLKFYEKITALLDPRQRTYLFLDEVQRLSEPGRFLKGLYDLNPNIKIIVSGSSSLEVRSKLKEYLTGRKKETHLYPICFLDWVIHQISDFHGRVIDTFDSSSTDQFVKTLEHNDGIYGADLRKWFWDMATFGGYPRVLLANIPDKMHELEEIYTSYVKKDVVEFMKIERPDLYNNLVKALAHQTGNLLNFSEVSSLLGGNQATIKKYTDMLNQTYVTHLLPPLLGNRRNEIKHAHKIFFIDSGLKNWIGGNLSIDAAQRRSDVLENTIFAEIFKNLNKGCNLFFWRTKAGTEVDFIIEAGDRVFIPIEVKLGPAKLGQLTKSFHSFIDTYKPFRAIFANDSTIGLKTFGGTEVFYLPYYWVPLVCGLWKPRSA